VNVHWGKAQVDVNALVSVNANEGLEEDSG